MNIKKKKNNLKQELLLSFTEWIWKNKIHNEH